MPHSHRHRHPNRDFFGDINSMFDDAFGGGDEQDPKPTKHEGRDGGGVKTVYVTQSATFSGKVAGYKTLVNPEPTQESKKPAPPPPPPPKTSTQPKPKAATTSSRPSVIHKPTKASSLDTVLAKATGHASSKTLHSTTSSDFGSDRALSTSSSLPSATQTGDSSSSKSADSGTSAGAKAGIAFGVLGGLFLVGMLVFFFYNRRKREAQAEAADDHNEKMHGMGGVGGPDRLEAMPTRNAPRLSLRPVTQFLPNWNPADKPGNKGAAVGAAVGAAGAAGNTWDRPSTSASNHPSNPFGNQAERIPSPIAEQRSIGPNSPGAPNASPFDDPLTASGPVVAGGPAAAAAVAAAAGGAAPLGRKTSLRKNGDFTAPPIAGAPPSPAGTEFSTSSLPPGVHPGPSAGAAAIAAAGGPATSAVHRVQLDFNPTLEDEMGLKAGDLVRLLHEYDDGWALCIRLDRSQQGVVPRTCLSTRPVKPRPPPGAGRPGPPINPQGYPRGPGGPGGPQGRPMTPQGRPMTPQGRPMTPQGRPMTPQMGPGPRNGPGPGPSGPGRRPQSPAGYPGGRSQSPGPRYQGPPQGRPQSPNRMPQRNSPPSSSPMNPAQSPPQGPPTGPVGRKPVPGQAY